MSGAPGIGRPGRAEGAGGDVERAVGAGEGSRAKRGAEATISLSFDPFREPRPTFFKGADRQRQLDELKHLNRWSRRLLVVTGPAGIGKTSLFRALSSSLDPKVKAARLCGTFVTGERDILVAIVQGFGLAMPADTNTQVLSRLIREHVRDQRAAGRHCAVLLDDAHMLEPRAIARLTELTTGDGDESLSIALFAEPFLVQTLDKAARRHEAELSWHEIRLAGFPPGEVRRYIEFRFREAGYEGRLPFSEHQMRELITTAKGLPEQVNRLAGDLLDSERTASERGSGEFPPLHRSLAIIIAVVLGIVYLVWDALQSEGAPAPEVAEVRETPARRPVVSVADPTPIPIERAGGATLPAAGETVPLPAEEVVPARVDETEPAEAPAAVVRRVAPAAASEPPPVPDTAPPEAELAAASPRDAEWIRAQPADRYTLQLLASSTRERVTAYLARQHDQDAFAHFEMIRDGTPLYVVLYGSFPDRAAALAAAGSLPDTVGKVQPWIRSFESVQGSF